MSPEIDDKPLRISFLNPADTATAMIITRKLTATETMAMPPLNLRRLDMNKEASIILTLNQDGPEPVSVHFQDRALQPSEGTSSQASDSSSFARQALHS
jgi:hypothetical protein